MTLKIYNTQSRQVETFQPLNPQQVTFYVCGPTVYDLVHIGTARPAVVFDTLYRLLQLEYPLVKYARNITDIDDKIITAARANGEDIAVLAERYTEAYVEDMAAIGNLEPNIMPRATDHIGEMIAMIAELVERGHAYTADGHVLFDVRSMSDYGALSNRSLQDMLDGARVEVASYKKYAGDFVLWKPSKDGDPSWESPWGSGRPGWHIECSAMIAKHLGKTIDIHGGGRDLVFPHHENECAQSQCAHGGEPLAKYWMHNGYINIGGEKMSKSLGNFRTVRDLLSQYKGEVIRYTLLRAHYRSELDFSIDQLNESKSSLDTLYTALRRTSSVQCDDLTSDALRESRFYQSLLNDLATPEALSELHQLASALNTAAPQQVPLLKSKLCGYGKLLGLLQGDVEEWFQSDVSHHGSESALSNNDIDDLIKQRQQAKLDKNYARADEIRQDLLENGVVLEDSREGTQWRRV